MLQTILNKIFDSIQHLFRWQISLIKRKGRTIELKDIRNEEML